MTSRALIVTSIASAALMIVALAPADAKPFDEFALEPIGGAGIDCGPAPQISTRPDMKFWNYDSAVTSCTDAVAILDAFVEAEEKYATIGAWDCGINGAAEAERTGILLKCVGPRGPLHALQIEAPL